MKTLEGAGPLVKTKTRKVRKALSKVVRRKRSSIEAVPLTEHEEGPLDGSTAQIASSSEDQWTDVDLSETTQRLKHVTIKDDAAKDADDVKPGTSTDPDVIEVIDIQEIETGKKKKKKKKKKFSKKKMRKKTWKAMKSSWRYMKAGLVMLSNTSVSWSVTGAVNNVVQDYYSNRDYRSSSYRSYGPSGR